MTPESYIAIQDRDERMFIPCEPLWAIRASLLWKHRRMLARVGVIAFLVSLGIAFTLPKHYRVQVQTSCRRTSKVPVP